MTVTNLRVAAQRPLSAVCPPEAAYHSLVVLEDLCAEVFASLSRADQRRWASTYVTGLAILRGRKSIRRISVEVARAACEQSLQQFVNQSPWAWAPVREALARRVAHEAPPRAWVLGEIAIPKNGSQSVGVARQFAPGLGRTLNCQIGLAASIVTDAGAAPVDWHLLVPSDWSRDRERCKRTGLPPQDCGGQRWHRHLQMLDHLTGPCGFTPAPAVVDMSADPRGVRPILQGLGDRRLNYLVQVPHDTVVCVGPQRIDRPLAQIAMPGAAGAAHLPWRGVGAGGREQSLYVRATLPSWSGSPSDDGRRRVTPRTVLCRWQPGRSRPAAVYLTNLDGVGAAGLAELVGYQSLADRQLDHMADDSGLHHFEGRSYRGWHHHMTLASIANAAGVVQAARDARRAAMMRHAPVG